MNEYRAIARVYFRTFEGVERYPFREASLWLGLGSVLGFLVSLAFYLFTTRSASFVALLPTMFFEALALLMFARVRRRKQDDTLRALNFQEGTAFSTIARCKAHMLCKLLHASRSDFLGAAEEIDRLRTLESRFRSKSEILRARKWLFVYDPAAKDRLANWALAFCSALLAVAVAGDSKLDYLVDVASSPALPGLLVFLATLVGVLFAAVLGIALGASFCWEVARFWVCRMSLSSSAGELETNYLCRDLIQLHRRPPIRRRGADRV